MRRETVFDLNPIFNNETWTKGIIIGISRQNSSVSKRLFCAVLTANGNYLPVDFFDAALSIHATYKSGMERNSLPVIP